MNSPSAGPPERELLAAFFGPERAAGYPDDPAVVLAVDQPRDKASIVTALQRELAELAAHPFGDSPEAVEVRLVLQQCASRLLDEADVASGLGLAAAPKPSTPPPPPAAPAPSPIAATPAPAAPLPVEPAVERTSPIPLAEAPRSTPPPAKAPPVVPAPVITPTGLERDAARILAQSRSVEEAIRSLTALALARGLPASTAQRAIANLTAVTRGGGPASTAPIAPSRAAEPGRAIPDVPLPEDPGQVLVRRVVLIGLGVAVLCIAGVVGIIIAASRGSKPAAAVGPAAATAPTGAFQAVTAGQTAAPAQPAEAAPTWTATGQLGAGGTPPEGVLPSGERVAGDVALARLRTALSLIKTDPRAARSAFVQGLEGARRWWATHEPSTRVACVEALIDYLYALPDAGAQLDAAALLAPPSAVGQPLEAEGVWPAAWSGGVLWRLSRERELPGSVVVRIQTLLTDAVGTERPSAQPTFADGAALALESIPRRLLARYAAGSDASAGDGLSRGWALWSRAAEAAWPAARARRAQLDAVTRLLAHKPDSTSSRAVHDAIVRSVTDLDWTLKDDDSARARMLSWFPDPNITTANLALVTQTLITRARVDGVDATMVLSPGAGDEPRAALREAYATAWNLQSAQAAAWVGENLRSAIDNVLEQSRQTGIPIDDLRSTVLLIRATQVLSGKTGSLNLNQMISMLNDPAYRPGYRAGMNQLRNWEWSTGSPRGFGVEYLAGDRTLAARLEAINRLSEGTQLSIMEAEVLAEACFTAGSPEVRAAAQKAAVRLGDQWSLVYGVLQALPKMGRSEASQRFLTTLTQRTIGPPGGATFMLEARRAVLERLLELVADADDTLRVDRLAAEVAEGVGTLAGTPVNAGALADEDAGPAAADAARRLYLLVRAEAGLHVPNELAPWRLDQLDRRRAGRLAAAVGPIQLFAADQVSAAEALAYVVTGEHPGQAEHVKEIMDRMQADRRSAGHIFSQTKAVQRAIVELWRLRAPGAGKGTR